MQFRVEGCGVLHTVEIAKGQVASQRHGRERKRELPGEIFNGDEGEGMCARERERKHDRDATANTKQYISPILRNDLSYAETSRF